MRFCALLFCLCSFAAAGRAAPTNLASMSCARYQNEMMAPAVPAPGFDSINTMMWLFGFSVARGGSHVMYGDALAGFGFALDAECKNNPDEALLAALAKIKPDTKNPMDLSEIECQTFASRHLELVKSDRESADTIMMWLYGFAVAKSGSRLFEPGGLGNFEGTLLADCQKYPGRSLFDELTAVKFPKAKN